MADNRTEKATPKRRNKAREHGQVLRSRDLVSAMTLLGVVTFMSWGQQSWIAHWKSYFSNVLDLGVSGNWENSIPVIVPTAMLVGSWLWPLFSVALGVALFTALMQGSPTFAVEALAPNFERFNPANNVKQLFSLAGISRVLRSLLPTTLMLYLAMKLILQHAEFILHSERMHALTVLTLLGSLCYGIAWRSGMVFLGWSGLDYLLQWRTYENSLKMTKQEVRDEAREGDGNPEIRTRIRKLRRDLMRKSLQKSLQRATAVITNPTHYAVALEYHPGTMGAPIVVAKGKDLIAKKIKELARWHEVPIIENAMLAQALYKATEIGQMIPPNLYAAVAEILAFVFRAQMRMRGAVPPAPSQRV